MRYKTYLETFRKIIELFYLSIPTNSQIMTVFIHIILIFFFHKIVSEHQVQKAKRDAIHTLMKLGKSPTRLDQEKVHTCS